MSGERRFPFYREGQSLDVPAGWQVYDRWGLLVRTEWNPDRPKSDLEQALKVFTNRREQHDE